MQTIIDLFKASYWCAPFILFYVLAIAIYPIANYYRCQSFLFSVKYRCPQKHDPPYKLSESLWMCFVFVLLLLFFYTIFCARSGVICVALLLFCFLSVFLSVILTHHTRRLFWHKHLAHYNIEEKELDIWHQKT